MDVVLVVELVVDVVRAIFLWFFVASGMSVTCELMSTLGRAIFSACRGPVPVPDDSSSATAPLVHDDDFLKHHRASGLTADRYLEKASKP